MEATKNWYAAAITVAHEATEAVEFVLDEFGAEGTEIDLLGRRALGSPTVVKGYFTEPIAEEMLWNGIEDALSIYGFESNALQGIDTYQVQNEDWLAEWKKHWKPTEIGKFVIAPPWEDLDATDKIVIRIEPNMAFGTGTHDTTRLCLKAIGELYRDDMSVLDVGTGTGILAIAAAKLGATDIHACDTDIDSVKIARENAGLNQTAWIDFREGPLGADVPEFDFVFANLTIDVIVPILDLLLAKTRSILLLSGILAEQRSIIEAELLSRQRSNFTVETSGEWISVVVKM
jgi:ribosomal protein L11 methyltransferase